jgi:hypothetical protein
MSNQIDDTNAQNEKTLKECRKNARIAFWKVAKEGLWTLIEQAPSQWSGPEGRFYQAEKAIISKHVEPIYWGAVVSLALFATFRLSGSRMYSRFRESFVKKASTNPANIQQNATASSSSQFTQTKKPEQWRSYLDQQAEKTSVTQKELFELPADIIISITCGCSAILLLIQPKQIKDSFIEAPLNHGKSVVADIFCPAMISAYKKSVDPRIVTKDNIQNDDTINMFLSFVKNCRTRSDYVAYREQLGTVKRPDVIPYPGLEGVRR